jgi:hypothetical protein
MVYIKKRKNIENYREQILRGHSEGKSLKEICTIVGFYPDKISKFLKANGLRPSHNNKTKWVDEHFFDTIDSEEKAYILGYFIADGCVREEYDKRNGGTRYRLCFSNSCDDEEIILKIHDRICPYNKIMHIHRTSGAKNRKPQLQLQWTSRGMTNNLMENFGVRPSKTYDVEYAFPFEKIDRKYHRDFIRGFIDGDGTLSKEDIRFVFNSPVFAKQIIDILYQEVYIPNKDIIFDFKYTLEELVEHFNGRYSRDAIQTQAYKHFGYSTDDDWSDEENSLSARLFELQKTKQEIETKKVMDAFRKSGKSMQELMTFLEV